MVCFGKLVNCTSGVATIVTKLHSEVYVVLAVARPTPVVRAYLSAFTYVEAALACVLWTFLSNRY